MNNIDLLNGLHEIYNKPFIANLKNTMRNYPDVDFTDALSIGQIKSKSWLIAQLHYQTGEGYLPGDGMVWILGGWYGTLAAMMFEPCSYINVFSANFHNMKIRSFDIDPECAVIADSINKSPWVMDNWQFKATTKDMNQINYNGYQYSTLRADGSPVELYETPDVIINTSCEHLLNFQYWWDLIPEGMLCALQSNNFHGEEGHVNCIESLNEFELDASFSKILYSGELEFEKYTRYMIIGEK